MIKKQFFKKFLLPVIILLLAASVFVAFVQSKPKVGISQVEEKIWGVETIDITLQTLAPQIILYGIIDTPQYSQLTAAISADVADVKVKIGETVEKKDLLVQLDHKDNVLLLKQRNAELAEIRALIKIENARFKNDKTALEHEKQLLELSQQEFERAQSLERNKLSTQANIDQANQAVIKQRLAVDVRQLAITDHSARIAQLRAKADKATALRDLAKVAVQRSKIVAPFPGKITSVKVAQGDRVRIGDILVEIYDQNALEVRAQIPTQFLNMIQDALTANENLTARSSNFPHDITFKLDRLSGAISQGSGGQDAFFTISGVTDNIPLGRTLELQLSLPAAQNAIAIPRSAIYGSNRIYLYQQGRMIAHTVDRLGEYKDSSNRRLVLIKDPLLNEGDQLIVTQLPNAIDGLRVKTIKK